MALEIEEKTNNLQRFQKMVELLVGSRLRYENRAKNAIKIQDSIRLKVKGWNGTKEIRKWRERKAS